ncbi:MAG TPA: glycosyltransferase family 4 protein [Clostridia bacterium]|nr:glycosyltransferase family 4 protein [Clostridia bacterium]
MISPRKRSALILGNFLSAQGGSRGVCEDLADHLRLRGWHITTASHRKPKLLRLLDMLSTAVHCRHRYAVAQVDVFSGSAFFWAEAAVSTLRRLRKPIILTLHGGNLPRFGARWPKRVHHLLSSANLVTAPSSYLEHEMHRFCPAIQIVPNPVNVDACQFRERTQPAPNLVWLRAFHEIYNPLMAIKALALLRQSLPKARLVMIGPDKGDGSFQRTQAEVKSLGLQDAVEFKGQIPKSAVPAALNQADIFLNTTNFDNTPVSVVEAMACGLCVVSTNPGGMPFLVNHGVDGLLVNCGDADAMAKAILQILNQPGLARACSLHARKKVEGWSWPAMLPVWDDLLCSVQNQAPLPQPAAACP